MRSLNNITGMAWLLTIGLLVVKLVIAPDMPWWAAFAPVLLVYGVIITGFSVVAMVLVTAIQAGKIKVQAAGDQAEKA